jgi:O-antigen/teichoic acid export membrane protein
VALLRPLGSPVWHVDRFELRLGIHFSSPFFVDALRQSVDRIVLGLVAPAAELAIYGSAVRIMQTSQVAVSSLNRIIYPRFAEQAHVGLRGALQPAFLYGVVVTVIALATSLALFLSAPLLPFLIGGEYGPVVGSVRTLCWVLLPLAIQSVPYDVFGAFDYHSLRAKIYNGFSLLAVAITALAVYGGRIEGAYASAYLTQIVVAIALWTGLFRASRREGECPRLETIPAAPQARPRG